MCSSKIVRRWMVLALATISMVTSTGCDYGAAVLQNLGWGLGGMVQSILVNQDLSGAPSWIIGALVNGAVYGHQ